MANNENLIGALAACNQAERLDPQNIEVFYYRGYVNYKLRDYEKAITDFTKVIELGGRLTKGNYLGRLKYAEVYNERGNEKSYLENYGSALVDYNMAIGINTRFAKAIGNRGNVKVLLGDTLGAMTDFDRAIITKPKDFENYINRGLVKGDLEDYNRAIQDFNIAISLAPNSSDSYVGRAYIKDLMKDYEGAIFDLSTSA